jgi:uncharacterized membrane protein YdjX (TVP38/TMEM64 family)
MISVMRRGGKAFSRRRLSAIVMARSGASTPAGKGIGERDTMDANRTRKIGIGLLLASLVAAFLLLDLRHYLTLHYLQSSQARFAALYAGHRPLVLGAYFLLYVLVTALSLPGAAVMTLAGGALFGFWTGLAVVSFASSIGATLAFLVSRFLLRDWVQNRFGDRIGAVNEGIEREGAFYLFTLRLIPIFPFFVINLVMGLTRMAASTFYWVSQVGMLAGTAVYVNAGKELAGIRSLSEILSPRILIAFALLGLFPLAAKKAVGFIRDRQEKRDKG